MVINALLIYCVYNFRAIIFLLATDNTTNVEQFISQTVLYYNSDWPAYQYLAK